MIKSIYYFESFFLNKLLKPDPYYNYNLATLGDRLFVAIESFNLSQEVLVKKIGIRKKTLILWKNDNLEPNANKIQIISGFLKVLVVWLISGLCFGIDNQSLENEMELSNESRDIILEIQSVRLEQH